MRIALGIEYDGTAYNGWQRQKSGIGVQQRVEEALTRVANQPINTVCAGRTDTGVHASAQVVHFDTQSKRELRGWLLGTNSNLPDDISATWVRMVGEEFHARFSALSRTYCYLILNRDVRSALQRNRAWWVHQRLDLAAMREASLSLVGRHDFSAFRAAGCQASTPVREVSAIDIESGREWISITIIANAFLQHMVRNVVGLLVSVASGESPVSRVQAVLESRDRRTGGVTAPPHGLTLTRVSYPDEFALPNVDCQLGLAKEYGLS
jgi:tRNA pseudouridine38-40 synthase